MSVMCATTDESYDRFLGVAIGLDFTAVSITVYVDVYVIAAESM